MLAGGVDEQGLLFLRVVLIDLGRARTTRSAHSAEELSELCADPVGRPTEYLAALYGAPWGGESSASTSGCQVKYSGLSGVLAFDKVVNFGESSWSVECDHLGLLSCIHQLLFGEDLVLLNVEASEAARRSYPVNQDRLTTVRVARSQFKR